MITSSLEASKLIRKHQGKAPIPVIKIAHLLGLKVYTSSDLEDDISGMILREADRGGSSGYSIYVNAGHPLVRRRFTIAHEIGHFVLHKSLIGDGVRDDALYRSKLSTAVEAEANRFAADLLMPWSLINEAMERGRDTVEELAQDFRVSRSSMSIRLGVPYETSDDAANSPSTGD